MNDTADEQSRRDLHSCGPVRGSSRRSKVAITLRRDEAFVIQHSSTNPGFHIHSVRNKLKNNRGGIFIHVALFEARHGGA